MADSLVKGVVGKLGSALWDEIGLLRSFKDDAKDLKTQLEKIQAVLLDAEKRSSVENEETRALSIWLRELKGAAYDIDDLLDEIRTQAVLQQQPHEVQNENQLAKMEVQTQKISEQFVTRGGEEELDGMLGEIGLVREKSISICTYCLEEIQTHTRKK